MVDYSKCHASWKIFDACNNEELIHLFNTTKWYNFRVKWLEFNVYDLDSEPEGGLDTESSRARPYSSVHNPDASWRSTYIATCEGYNLFGSKLHKSGEGHNPELVEEWEHDVTKFFAWAILFFFLGLTAFYLTRVWYNRHGLQATLAAGLRMFENASCRIYKWLRWQIVSNEDEAKILKLAAMRRSSQALAAIRIVAPIVWIVMLPTVWHLFALLQDDRFEAKYWIRRVLKESGVVMALLSSSCVYFIALPHYTTPRRLDIANVLLGILWIWRTANLAESTYHDQSHFHFHQAWIIFVRTVQTIILGNARLTTLLQILWVVSDIYIFSWIGAYVAKAPEPDDANYYLWRQLGLGMGAVGLVWAFEWCRLAEVRAAWTAEQSTGAYKQLSRILSAMCDAVITLDSSLQISGGPANGMTKLQSLLMFRISETVLIENKPFTDFLQQQDQERFRLFMKDQEADSRRNDESIGTQTQSIHLHLKDRYGLPLAVQLFCSTLLDSIGEPLHLLGIRSDTDAETAGLATMRQREEDANSSSLLLSSASIPEATVVGLPADVHMSLEEVRSHSSRRSESQGVRRRHIGSRSSASSRSGSSSSPGRVSSSDMRVPPWATKMSENQLLAVVSSCLSKIPCDRQSCCLWHDAFSQLRAGMLALEQSGKACQQKWKPNVDWQCGLCKALNLDDNEDCGICGSEQITPPPPPTSNLEKALPSDEACQLRSSNQLSL